MSDFLNLIIILLFSIILIFPLHVVVNRLLLLLKIRLTPHSGVLFSILVGNILTQCFLWKFVLLKSISSPENVFWSCLYFLIVYNSFSFLYFFFLTTTETSIHFHIITEIFLEKDGLTRDDFNKKYNDEAMINARLERLIDLGQVQEKNDKYYVKGGFFLLIIKVIDLWRMFLGIKQ